MIAPEAGGGARRRLAAILAADVVGWSRGMAEDEAGALTAVRVLRREVLAPALAAHGGRLFKAMGDGFLAEFPSAVEAASCAVAVQRRLAPPGSGDPMLRVGVAVGDVVVEQDGDVFGAAVNLAARLQAAAGPGEIVVSRAVHEQLLGRLALPFEDRGERALKNIPEPARLFVLTAAAIAALPAPAPLHPRAGAAGRGRRPDLLRHAAPVAGGAVLALSLAAGAAWWAVSPRPEVASLPPAATGAPAAEPSASHPAAPRMSMVVLPFVNLGGDAGQDHVADGITDDLTTAVGRISHALVIGRGTAFTYKGRAADAREVGRELGVRYVVEGSARRTGERLWVSARLVDAGSGAQLWAESFDEPFGELSAVISAVVSRVVATLGDRVHLAEFARSAAERPDKPDALDLMLRGRVLFSSAGTFESYGEARRLFARAVELDPGSAQAHALLAHLLTGLWSIGWPEDREGLLRDAEAHAAHALALDPQMARAYYVRGVIAEARRRYDSALAAFDVATELNPNFVFVHARRGWVLLFTDRPEEGAAEFRRAISISPRDRGIGSWHNGLAIAALMVGRDAEALGHVVRAAAASPNFHYAQVLHAGCLALAGRAEEARAAWAEFLRLRPGATVAWIRRDARERSDHPLYVATHERLVDALRAVGLPEG